MRRVLSATAIMLLALAAAAQTVTVPSGTPLRVRLDKTLTTTTNKAGDQFTGHLMQAITLDGKTAIPSDVVVEGRVTSVSEPRRIAGKPTIGLHPEAVLLPGGQRLVMDASLVDTSLRDGSSVNGEGQFKGSGHDKKDLLIIGGAAGTGMLIGGLAGGGPGVAIGGAIGAGGGTTRWLLKHRSADIPAGTELFIELNRALTIGTPEATPGQ